METIGNIVKVDDVEYDINVFSEDIRSAIGMYNDVVEDFKKAQYEAVKCQAALMHMITNILAVMRSEIQEKVPK